MIYFLNPIENSVLDHSLMSLLKHFAQNIGSSGEMIWLCIIAKRTALCNDVTIRAASRQKKKRIFT